MTQHLIMRGVIPRIRFVSDGTLAEYDFPFAIFKNSDLKVYFGSEIQSSDTYTVSGAGESDGGTVTLSHVPANGVIITLTRELAIERTSDFQEGGALRANTLNHELDYQIACQQQIADNLNRSMVLPPYATDTNVNLTLPLPSAGKAIVWNSEGTNLENSTIEVNALESTLKGYKVSAETAATQAASQASEAMTQAQNAANQATTATTQAGIATAAATTATAIVASKANKDMDNLSATGKEKIIMLGMPDYSAIVSRTKDTSYTADSYGFILGEFSGVGAEGKITINGKAFSNNGSQTTITAMYPVSPGDTYSFTANSGYSYAFWFIPCKGISV